jgi:hypothetical protein
MTTAATTVLPKPLAISGAVSNESESRTLVVRRPKETTGYAAFLWRQAHEALVNAEERGWPSSMRFVWCSASGNPILCTPRLGESDVAVSLSGRVAGGEGLHGAGLTDGFERNRRG